MSISKAHLQLNRSNSCIRK